MDQPSWLPIPLILLCIIFGLLLLMYFIVGSIVRYHKGMRHCPEMLPNYHCWCTLLNSILVIITCGRCRPRFGTRLHNINNINRQYLHSRPNHSSLFFNNNNINNINISRRRAARDLAFEALQSDWEEYEEEREILERDEILKSEERGEILEINSAMQPASAVVVVQHKDLEKLQ